MICQICHNLLYRTADRMKHLCVASLLFALLNCQSSDDWYDIYEYNTYIDDEGMFQVFWTPDQGDCTIDIGLKVHTNSYVAFGISESGGMAASDIVIGWITPDGQYILQNRYSPSQSSPQLFSNQNGIKKKDGWMEDVNGTTITYLQFEKELFPDFDPNTVHIKIGTTRVIYAWGNDPMEANYEPKKHCDDCRAPQSMNLLQGEHTEVPLPVDHKTHDVLVKEHTLPSADTTYYCSLHQLPSEDDIQHLVRIDPVIEPTENQGVVHHILLYYCPEKFFNATDVGKGWICDEMKQNMAPSQCRGSLLVAAWAIGGGSFHFPSNVGLEILGRNSDAIQYVLMETHYDNPLEHDNIVDRSGFRLYYTPTLRQYSAGVIMMAMAVHPYGQFIPGQIKETVNYGYCFADCLEDGLHENQTEVYAFANGLHMHTLGVRQIFRHIRDGRELRPIDMNLAYDFNYQQFAPLPAEITIKRGDSFIVECIYDSSDKKDMTYGGESTREEMCMTFIYIYPKPKIVSCWSMFIWEDVNRFYFEAIELGYFKNATFDDTQQMYIDGFYDVTVDGALEFYDEFQTGNMYYPSERVSMCRDMENNPLSDNNARHGVLMPDIDYESYDIDDYYECGVSSGDDDSSFNWRSWYVYFGGTVIVVLFVGVLCCIYLGWKGKGAPDSYERVFGEKKELNYGTTKEKEQISMQFTKKM